MNKAVVYIGVDVAKASLDVAWAERSRRFANNKSGLSALTKWVKQSPFAVHLICEASGGYERGLLDAAEQNGIKVSLVQANRVRQYARAAGILAKTDKVDARVLCAFGSAMQPEPTPPLSAQQKQLRELETQRRHLSRMLVAEQNRLAQLNDKELQRLTRSLLGYAQKANGCNRCAHRRPHRSRTKASSKKRKSLPPLQAWARAPLCYCLRKYPS